MLFNDDPNMDVRALQRELKNIVDQLRSGAESFIIKNQAILTTETPIAHGLGFAPQAAMLVPYESVSWARSRVSDSRNCYFTVSGECSADVVVFP
jgi:hypothetical protein